ncbi:MAG: penicillin-binding transpeptidase domain-containing protein [Candidatus Paceibacteria bacterium]
MFRKVKKILKKKVYKNREIEPDEIFIDSHNLPEFNIDQFEGRIERPISKGAIMVVAVSFLIIGIIFGWKIWNLQIKEGESYASISENNRLQNSIIFADRGVIYDRNNTELVWNVKNDKDDFSRREYISVPGLSHTLGYVGYPLKDSQGVYYREEFVAEAGVEKVYDEVLKGESGLKIIETDALMQVQSESTTLPPENGKNITLSIDAQVQSKLYEFIQALALEAPFMGGAGVIININTGEILSMASYPEYDSQVLSDGAPAEKISLYMNNKNKPFLNRVVSGLYTPGSTVKLYMALAALNEKLIAPETEILSTGSISIPNPYFEDKESVFVDWKAHGLVDMREAIAVSSNVYFYEIGGGYEDQRGLGIKNIEKYMRMFGFGKKTDIYPKYTLSEEEGVIPNPKWKAENFDGDIWRIGDTYHTSIGQYGFQVTPLQAVRAVAAIANDGKLLTPTLLKSSSPDSKRVSIRKKHFAVVREGMRQAVTDGTGKGLHIPQVKVAAKTGTAQLGTTKQFVNSLVIGFFPYDNPKYAFAVIMEKGRQENQIGALFVMRELLEWMAINTPEYLE